MAIRLNTLLVVLSLPTLLSAAVTLHRWSRKRRNAIAPAAESPAQQTDNHCDDDTQTTDGNKETIRTTVVAAVEAAAGSAAAPAVGSAAAPAAETATSTCSEVLSSPPSPLSDPAPEPTSSSDPVNETSVDSRTSPDTAPPAPAIPQQLPVCDSSARRHSLPLVQGQETTTSASPAARNGTPDPSDKKRSEMRITDTPSAEVSVKMTSPATASISSPETSHKNSPAKISNGTTTAPNGRPANGSTMSTPDPTTDLSTKVEKMVLKPKSSGSNSKKQQSSESSGKKSSSSSKKEKAHSQQATAGAAVSAETTAKNPDSSATSDAQSPVTADGTADARSRKPHDSGDSVGGVSLDSGADLRSPVSSGVGPKSSDRSLDSPCPFKSDVSQGSPCNWGSSDSHSEGSSDSGKGSEIASTSYSPLQQFLPTLGQRTTANVVYQFEIPSDLVGKLIGRQGMTIKAISQQARARIVVNDYPYENCDHLKICTIDGDRLAISEALRLIRNNFPQSSFPNLTLNQINAAPIPSTQLYLVDGYPNDVIMSSLVSAGQFFVQQPAQPTYESLSVLNHMMAVTYSEQDAPAISSPSVGIIVAATVPSLPGWFRALIVGIADDESFCDVKYVDYGGYSRLETSSLRQIRMDFMNLPFQACECYLSDVLPVDGDTWSAAATECFEKLAQGCVLKAIVTGVTEDACTLVRLYKTNGMTNMCLNEELVNRGLARWIQPPSAPTSAE